MKWIKQIWGFWRPNPQTIERSMLYFVGGWKPNYEIEAELNKLQADGWKIVGMIEDIHEHKSVLLKKSVQK